MQVTITIEIDESAITALAEKAAAEYLKAPATWGSDRGGSGYLIIAEQVKEAIKGLNLRNQILEVAARTAKGIVEDVTTGQIKKMAKEAVKKLKEEGGLL